ncbi:M48 family metallopeptidase [Propionivibrio dicarboxylicus]|uniref:Peptidase family M48 n=1 Tax=Propionivibrio dicarboxylicus TaxID=83767 RepID=A0A1G8ID66_9RHOO|nr:M48 family metallopeptidase [Propionivibrio dicarboxylicus]SDI16836.1 Peptidase family M48 [Propionivibrio dicarboxylicus]
MSVVGDYYDGRSTRRRRVTLDHDRGFLQVRGDDVERREALAALRLSEPMGAAPRLVTFSDGAFCEIRDHAGLQRLLAETGHRDACVVRWQFSVRWIAVASLFCLAALFAAYRWGLPWVSARVADALPDSVAETVSDRVLAVLDERYLAPSRLPEARQAAIAARFSALAMPGEPVARAHLVFRANRAMSANALALPSGTIILTDDLVALARRDNELMAVLAHELGHVEERHGLRQAVQSTLVGLLAAWFLGDVSSVVAAAPAVLLEAKYSRDAEREADLFAERLLQANGISPRCLVDILQRLDHAESSAGSAPEFLSTHPETIRRSEALVGGACE